MTRGIVVGERRFEVKRYDPDHQRWFKLHISVEESTANIPGRVFNRIIEPGRRRDLTNEYIENELEKWAENHPEFTISGFSIDEGSIARVGELID